MNVLDGRRFVGLLAREGFSEAASPEEAGVILLNTCSVRDKAEQKVYDRLGLLAKLKRERPDTVLGVCGCVAQQEGESLLDRLPQVDFVLGTGRIEALPSVLRRVEEEGDRPCETGFDPDEVVYTPGAIARSAPHRAAIADTLAVAPALPLPVQSGSDAVLRRMKRQYTRAEYLDLVASLRDAIP